MIGKQMTEQERLLADKLDDLIEVLQSVIRLTLDSGYDGSHVTGGISWTSYYANLLDGVEHDRQKLYTQEAYKQKKEQ